ncbi:MAG: oxygen-independent coproporphyrinogen III oxidase, partial [Gammaproteobacteria bacterium]
MFNRELIGRYDLSGPRYTSYPSALEFHEQFGMDQYQRLTESTNEELVPRPLSLYVHLPFCNTVCYYCACNKIITANRERARPYLEDLHREIAMQGNLFDKDRVVKQMHWGGGTPTFISNEQTITLMQKLWQHFKLLNDDSGEYSIEIDPRQIKPESIGLLRTLGFNRLSLGVQDFDPAVQQAVNRNQSYEQTLFAFEEARKHGFHSVNMDLIYGLPRQTVDTFSDTIDKVINLSPERIAIYNYAHLPHVFKVQKQINENELPDAETKLQILERAI